jgi:hypothetical protein
VSLNPEKADQYIKTNKAFDANVIGVVSSNPNVTIKTVL